MRLWSDQCVVFQLHVVLSHQCMNLSSSKLAKENRCSDAKLHISEMNADADYSILET